MSETSFQIRQATCDDARAIYALIHSNPNALVSRSMSNVVERIDRFLVAVTDDGEIVGTLAYEILPEIGDPSRTTIELQSVCVKEGHRGLGIGRKIVECQIERLLPLRPWQIVVLTFEVEFFGRLGFVSIDKRLLIHKLYRGCINCSKHESPFTCPEQAMVRKV